MTEAENEAGAPDSLATPGGGVLSSSNSTDLDLLKVAVEAVGEAILVTSPELDSPGPRIEYANPAFAHMTGYTPGEVLGRTPRMLQGPATDRAFLDRLRATLAAGQSFQGEAVNYRKDGTEYNVEWLITPVLDGDGRVVHWVSAQRDVTERKQTEAHLRRLADEVNHRVNNTLAAVQSMALQTLRTAPCSEDTRAAFLGRLFALSRVHDLLAKGRWRGASLHDLAEVQLAHHRGRDPRRIEASGPELLLRPGVTVTLGLVLHELAANAAAHGALSASGGRVRLRWSAALAEGDRRLYLRWAEEGGPPLPGPPTRRGFGVRLIERGLAQELQADTRLLFKPSGLRCEIDAPLSAVIGEQ
ncbi:HWE histidine kinase domain-containing protein [Roseicella aquatilis]|uniref:histidine kinase n=1 Tax=Roseicella aquatilis TaxID=2527868 RepID=A0A4R4D4A3_9PROT|nr:HWE histidine kinase domain-containing protein [Roseicella aquatilis]TCZ50675.1 PAS domain-containing protein [Roseicella aquatilis]